MLIGLIGDIHANIDALTAMLDTLDRLAVRRIFCAGDVVGYGAAPKECIELLRERGIPCVCGNHDFYTAHPDQYDMKYVRPEANAVIAWNQKVLSREHLDWLADLPRVIEQEHFLVTHASCQPYPEWGYMTNQRNAALQVLFQTRPICFNAHSHVPVIAMHRPGRSLTLEFFHNLLLPEPRLHSSVCIGIGAVGQPRDEDPRACAILYNDTSRTATILRVKYDIRKAQQRIIDNGLPHALAARLSRGE